MTINLEEIRDAIGPIMEKCLRGDSQPWGKTGDTSAVLDLRIIMSADSIARDGNLWLDIRSETTLTHGTEVLKSSVEGIGSMYHDKSNNVITNDIRR